MKKSKFVIAFLLVALFALFAMGSSESTDEPAKDQGKDTVQTEATVDENAIGDYTVVIDSCRLAKDYEGNPVVIVKYIFTNVSNEDAISFMVAIDENVYQGGIGLNEAWILDDSANYSADNQTKEIKMGATLEVEVAYTLNDTTTDIEVEVKELFSFDDTTLTKTFSKGASASPQGLPAFLQDFIPICRKFTNVTSFSEHFR